MTAFAHLSPAAREALELPLEGRRAYAQSRRWTPHPPGDALVRRGLAMAAVPKGTDMPISVLIGPPRIGGLAILERICAAAPSAHRLRRPAVWIGTGAGFNARRTCTAILAALDYPHLNWMRLDQLRAQTVRALVQYDTRLLCLHRFHHAAALGRLDLRQNLIFLHTLAEEAGVGLLLAGNGGVRVILKHDRSFASRCEVQTLTNWPQKPWVADVVADAIGGLPLRHPSPVGPELLDALEAGSGGSPGLTFLQLKLAAGAVIGQPIERITPVVIRSAAVAGRLRTAARDPIGAEGPSSEGLTEDGASREPDTGGHLEPEEMGA